MKTFVDAVMDNNPFALCPTGHAKAIVGMAYRGENMVYVISRDQCIEKLMTYMEEEEASEFFEYNIEGAYMGEHTPFFIND